MVTLSKLKQYFQNKKQATLAEITAFFQSDTQQTQHMLQHFINKGCVICRPLKRNCGTRCTLCPLPKTQCYEWVATTSKAHNNQT